MSIALQRRRSRTKWSNFIFHKIDALTCACMDACAEQILTQPQQITVELYPGSTYQANAVPIIVSSPHAFSVTVSSPISSPRAPVSQHINSNSSQADSLHIRLPNRLPTSSPVRTDVHVSKQNTVGISTANTTCSSPVVGAGNCWSYSPHCTAASQAVSISDSTSCSTSSPMRLSVTVSSPNAQSINIRSPAAAWRGTRNGTVSGASTPLRKQHTVLAYTPISPGTDDGSIAFAVVHDDVQISGATRRPELYVSSHRAVNSVTSPISKLQVAYF